MAIPTTALLDAFTRANADPLDGSWTGPILSGNSQLRLVSNTAQGRVATDSNSYWTGSTFGASQEEWVTLTTKWTTNAANMVIAATNLGAAGLTCYFASLFTSGTDSIDIYRVDASAFTQLGATISSLTISSGNLFMFSHRGGVVDISQNTGTAWVSLGTRSDSTYTTGSIGLAIDQNSGVVYDNFGGGTSLRASKLPVMGVG